MTRPALTPEEVVAFSTRVKNLEQENAGIEDSIGFINDPVDGELALAANVDSANLTHFTFYDDVIATWEGEMQSAKGVTPRANPVDEDEIEESINFTSGSRLFPTQPGLHIPPPDGVWPNPPRDQFIPSAIYDLFQADRTRTCNISGSTLTSSGSDFQAEGVTIGSSIMLIGGDEATVAGVQRRAFKVANVLSATSLSLTESIDSPVSNREFATGGEITYIQREVEVIDDILAIPPAGRSTSDPTYGLEYGILIAEWERLIQDQVGEGIEQISRIDTQAGVWGTIPGFVEQADLDASVVARSNASAAIAANYTKLDDFPSPPSSTSNILARRAATIQRQEDLDSARSGEVNEVLTRLYNERYFWLAERVNLLGSKFKVKQLEGSVETLEYQRDVNNQEISAVTATLTTTLTTDTLSGSTVITVEDTDRMVENETVVIDEGGASEETVIVVSIVDDQVHISNTLNPHPPGTIVRVITL